MACETYITYFTFLPFKITMDTWSSGKTLTQCSHLWPTVVWHRQIPVLNRAVYFNALQQRPPLMRETHARIVECPSFYCPDRHSNRFWVAFSFFFGISTYSYFIFRLVSQSLIYPFPLILPSTISRGTWSNGKTLTSLVRGTKRYVHARCLTKPCL
jgi:hypothetical protein